MNFIVTVDKIWCLHSNAIRRKQWVAPGDDPISMPKPELSPSKNHVNSFLGYRRFDVCLFFPLSFLGIIHYEFLPQNQTITANLYREQLVLLHNAIQQKRPYLVNRAIFFKTMLAYTLPGLLKNKFANFDWNLLPHSPYSPDIAPPDYCFFRSLKNFMRG